MRKWEISNTSNDGLACVYMLLWQVLSLPLSPTLFLGPGIQGLGLRLILSILMFSLGTTSLAKMINGCCS